MIIVVRNHAPNMQQVDSTDRSKEKKLLTTNTSKLTVGLSFEPLQARCPTASFHLIRELPMVAVTSVAVPARLIIMDVAEEVLNWKEMEA